MAPNKKWRHQGGEIYVLPKKTRRVKSLVKEARRGGLLGADRSGTW